jgi:hypothetical protein
MKTDRRTVMTQLLIALWNFAKALKTELFFILITLYFT